MGLVAVTARLQRPSLTSRRERLALSWSPHGEVSPLERIPRVYEADGPTARRAAQRNPTAASCLPRIGREESAQTRAETKGVVSAFGLGAVAYPLCRDGFCARWSDEVRVSQSSSDNPAHDLAEPTRVVHVFPVIEPEHLFVEIAEQVKRLDAHVGAVQAALQQTPEILAAVRVDLPRLRPLWKTCARDA